MDTLYTKVAGVTFEGRQAHIANIAVGDIVRLEPEPENPYDPNAIAVKVALPSGTVHHVGYVPREMAGVLAPHLGGENLMAKVHEVTGGFAKWNGEKASLGLIIRVDLPENFDARQ